MRRITEIDTDHRQVVGGRLDWRVTGSPATPPLGPNGRQSVDARSVSRGGSRTILGQINLAGWFARLVPEVVGRATSTQHKFHPDGSLAIANYRGRRPDAALCPFGAQELATTE